MATDANSKELTEEQRQAIEGIRRGLADVQAGKVRSREQAEREFRQRNGLPPRIVK